MKKSVTDSIKYNFAKIRIYSKYSFPIEQNIDIS